jgi:hypothetical protein
MTRGWQDYWHWKDKPVQERASARTVLVTTSRMPWTTDCLCIAIHHLAKGLHAGSQAKQLEARRNLRQGLKLQRPRRNRRRCSKLVHSWRCFPLWDHHPSLAAQGGQRRFSYFNIERDNSRYLANDTQSEWAFPGRKDQSMARGKKQ